MFNQKAKQAKKNNNTKQNKKKKLNLITIHKLVSLSPPKKKPNKYKKKNTKIWVKE